MIADKDRSGWFGASDTDKVIGNRNTDTFAKWWLQKIGINRDTVSNRYTSAGTHMEHRILASLGIPMELDKQIVLDDLRLRVNLDGNDDTTNYECKTYRLERGFTVPSKYRNQVQVQMFASGLRRTVLVAYGLTEADYNNYFLPILPERLITYEIAYDGEWIEAVYLPRLRYLAGCLKDGRFPT